MVVCCDSQNSRCRHSPSLTIVIKVGTSSLCHETTHYPLLSNISRIIETILNLKLLGHRVVLVTSAAAGTGLRRMNLDEKPKQLSQKQAIAAIGQGRLMSMYDLLFERLGQPIAQLLYTRNDIADHRQYLNAANCLHELLDEGVIPIVNENDAISRLDMKFGDNDTLSAVIAGMLRADYLFLLTDVDCLYKDNPRTNPNAKPVEVCEDIKKLRKTISIDTPGSSLGTGGMMTKIVAAEIATAAGVTTIITRGSTPENILPIIEDQHNPRPLHTRFVARHEPMIDRNWWILHGLHTTGTVVIEKDAANRLIQTMDADTGNCGVSLNLDAILETGGQFAEHQAIDIAYRNEPSAELVTIAKGIVNYSSAEIKRMGSVKKSQLSIAKGYQDGDCIVDHGNMTSFA